MLKRPEELVGANPRTCGIVREPRTRSGKTTHKASTSAFALPIQRLDGSTLEV